ncbi:MAG: His/Gly/Thr/Pro-type tRNA ligase C-terminal domain-containing protein, partial [Pseudomonadota bacterium]|nr:His/Gly/Thr/Pro-type tRNA ligase C-terminal domain-containing protein [Pseudomonadota bacterium]
SERLYKTLTHKGLDVLYDNRNERAGAKFSDMDLIGLPWQAVIGPRGAATGEIEVKNRINGDKQTLDFEAACALLAEPPSD